MSASKTYIVCWDEVFENTLSIEKALVRAELEYLVINKSSMQTLLPNWTKAKDTRYYGHFYTALEDFIKTENSIFIFNAGDSVWGDIGAYTNRIESIMSEDSHVGVISPDQTNDPFTGAGSYLFASSKHEGLVLSTLTNGILVALSRDVAELMHRYMQSASVDFYAMTSGWGLDYAYCAASYYLGKKVYKDTSVLMKHPTGSGYDYGVAAKEAYAVMDSFVEYCPKEKIDGQKIRSLFEVFMTKVHQKDQYAPTLKDVFVNGKIPRNI